MEIIIARHGETEYNRTRRLQGQQQIPLNENGRVQAGQIVETLGNSEITHIYCSGLQRARETADIVNESYSLPVMVDERLNERNFGAWENRYMDELLTEQTSLEEGGIRALFNVTPDQAETFEDMVERTTEFLRDITNSHGDSDVILIVSHGGPIRIMLGFIKGLDSSDYLDKIIGNGQLLRYTYKNSQYTCE